MDSFKLTAKQRSRSVTIDLGQANTERQVDVICAYLRQCYQGYHLYRLHKRRNGRSQLVVVLTDKKFSNKLCRENPHMTNGVKFLAVEVAEKTSGSQSPKVKEGETESERIEAILPLLGQLPSLTSQMERILNWLSLSLEDHQVRQDFIFRLENECSRALASNCKLYAFGSSVNRLGMKNCDLDLVLTTNGDIQSLHDVIEVDEIFSDLMIWPRNLPDQKQLINKLKRMFYSQQYNFGIADITPITSARIPLIKFRHISTNINCDLSFNRRMGVLNSRLIANVMEFSECARLLTFTIRLWGKQKNFVGGGGTKLNSYTITLMVIFYLQRVGVLPPLSQLKHSGNTIIDPKEGESFYTQPSDFKQFEGKMAMTSQVTLLQGFVEYYIRFPFEQNIVSVLHGEPIAVESKPLFNAKLINVQDPFEADYNTAKGVLPPMKRWFRKCLHEAWAHRDRLCYPSSNGEPWGLQYMLQSTNVMTQGKSQSKNSECNVIITLEIPEEIRERPTLTYGKVCSKVLQVLRDTYHMALYVPQSNHPLYDRLCQFHSPPTSSSSAPNVVDLTSEVVDLTGDGDQSAAGTTSQTGQPSTSSTAAASTTPYKISIEQYLPFTVQVRTRWQQLKDCSMLHPEVFIYNDYLNAVESVASKSNLARSSDFTISFQPHDAAFEKVEIELNDISTNHIQSIKQHLSKVLPQKIQHIF